MRQGRNKGQPGSARNRFHCVSRVVNRESIFGPVEREQFVRYMREFAEELFQAQRHRFGPKPSNGARRLRGLSPKLDCLHDLQRTSSAKHRLSRPKFSELIPQSPLTRSK